MPKLKLSVSVSIYDTLKLSLETRYEKISYLWELIFKNQHVMEQKNGMNIAITMDKEIKVITWLRWLILCVSLIGHWVPTLNNISRCACKDSSGRD